jgi:hypothetical protein
MKKIRIVSRVDGFRRAGIAHPFGPTIYDQDFFTKEQIAALKAEPILVVDDIDVDEKKNKVKDSGEVKDKQKAEDGNTADTSNKDNEKKK